jgi:hypothetical protein
MAYLKQRLETLLGHQVNVVREDEDWAPTRLVEVGEDYVGIEYSGLGLFLTLMARVMHIQHNPNSCDACEKELN